MKIKMDRECAVRIECKCQRRSCEHPEESQSKHSRRLWQFYRHLNPGRRSEDRRTQNKDPQLFTAEQFVAQNVKHQIEQIEHGKSKILTVQLSAMGRLHNYSFGNIPLAGQHPASG